MIAAQNKTRAAKYNNNSNVQLLREALQQVQQTKQHKSFPSIATSENNNKLVIQPNNKTCRFNSSFQFPLSYDELLAICRNFLKVVRKKQWQLLNLSQKRDLIFERLIDAIGHDTEALQIYIDSLKARKPELFIKLLERTLPVDRPIAAGDNRENVFSPIIINAIQPLTQPLTQPSESPTQLPEIRKAGRPKGIIDGRVSK